MAPSATMNFLSILKVFFSYPKNLGIFDYPKSHQESFRCKKVTQFNLPNASQSICSKSRSTPLLASAKSEEDKVCSAPALLPARLPSESSNWKPTRRPIWSGPILIGLLCLVATVSLSSPVQAARSTNCSPTPEFQVDVSPYHFILKQGMTASATITVTPKSGFTGTVRLEAVGVPREITNPSFNPATIDVTAGAQASTVSFGISPTAAIGLYSLDVNATTNGSLYHYTSISVRVPGPEIGISSDKLLVHLLQASSDASTVTVTSLYGFTGIVDFTIADTAFYARTPPTASLVPRSTSLLDGQAKNVTLTIFADQYATPGSYSVQVIAQSNSPAATNTTQVLVEVQGPDFALEAKPPALIIPPFSAKTIPLEVSSANKLTGDIALTVDITGYLGTPPSFHLADPIPHLNADQHLSDPITFITVGPGSFIANITGTIGLLAHYTLIYLDVREVHDFSLTRDPDILTIDRGGPSVTSQITVTSNNLADTIDLSIDCYPNEITANLSASSVILTSGTSATVTLTVSATRFTTPGPYQVSIFGAGKNSLSHNQTLVTVTVISTTPDFDISSNPDAVTIIAGDRATTTIKVNPKYGFTDSVNLTNSVPVAGPTFSLSASSIIGGSGSARLTISTDSSVPAGTYSVTVQGASRSLSHSVQVTVTVKSPMTTQQSHPETILGLAPNLVYAIAGVIVAAIVAGVGATVRMRKPKTP